MRWKTLLVAWHCRDKPEPILALDFHPKSNRLATAGADNTVKLWRVITDNSNTINTTCDTSTTTTTAAAKRPSSASVSAVSFPFDKSNQEDDSIQVEFIATLSRDAQAVNVVKFSPDGETIASGSDGGIVLLWKFNAEKTAQLQQQQQQHGGASATTAPGNAAAAAAISSIAANGEDEEDMNKEVWKVERILRGHTEDVLDLAWSPDSRSLVSGSVDNSVIVWDLAKGKPHQTFTDHSHYVQGVCWDPLNRYICTQSSDRTCRVYSRIWKKKKRKQANNKKATAIDDQSSSSSSNNNNNNDNSTASTTTDATALATEATTTTANEDDKNTNAKKTPAEPLGKFELNCIIQRWPTLGNACDDATTAAAAAASKKQTQHTESATTTTAGVAVAEGEDDNKENIAVTAAANNTTTASASASDATTTTTSAAKQQQQQQQHQQPKSKLKNFFRDELTATSFFRRLSFSPDGTFLVTTAGQFQAPESESAAHTAFVFLRDNWKTPFMHLPGHSDSVLAVSFCPTLFKLRSSTSSSSDNNNGNPSPSPSSSSSQQQQQQQSLPEATPDEAGAATAIPTTTTTTTNTTTATTTTTTTSNGGWAVLRLPYRMVFAVVCNSSVTLYDTQSTLPIAHVANLHYASLTCASWSADGLTLALSSRDGYCSIVCFDKNELGEPLTESEMPAHVKKRRVALISTSVHTTNVTTAADAVALSASSSSTTGVAAASQPSTATVVTAAPVSSACNVLSVKKRRIAPTTILLTTTAAADTTATTTTSSTATAAAVDTN